MGQETRTTDILGPKLTIETGNPQMGMPGRDSFKLLSTTDTGIRFIQAHTESGMSKIMSEGSLQIEVGDSDLVNPEQTTFQFVSHKGDFSINVDGGHIKIYGKAITIEASEQLVMQSPKIQIGYEEEYKTKDIKVLGFNVDIKSQKGTLADILMTSSFLKMFKGTLIEDLALIASNSPISTAVNILT